MINKVIEKKNNKELTIIIISSTLLGIWATEDSIALRNILLILGFVLGIKYWVYFIKSYLVKANLESNYLTFKWIPLMIICLMMVWVILHYSFFSIYPEQQFEELKSTWLRSLLAIVIGSATGLSLIKNKKNIWLLSLGLFLSFCVLIYQYLPKALTSKSFYGKDLFGDYIYHAKYNGVLAGTILISIILGFSFDKLRNSSNRNPNRKNTKYSGKKENKPIIILYSILGIFLPIYSFVFIFDSKNGVGVTGILLFCWIIIFGINYYYNKICKSNENNLKEIKIKYLFIYLFILIIFICAFIEQNKNNPGWGSIIHDIIISSKIKENTHWQNPNKNLYPIRKDGQMVSPNTYERVAWGVVGWHLIQKDILGDGITRSFDKKIADHYGITFTSTQYTHSAWIDLGLAYGWLGLFLLPTCILTILVRTLLEPKIYYRATIISLSIVMLVLYTVGEYGFQHGIEILFFVTSLLSTLFWKKSR